MFWHSDCSSREVCVQKLKHINIVTYKDSFIHDNHLCIVMSFCCGGDMHAQVNKTDQRNAAFAASFKLWPKIFPFSSIRLPECFRSVHTPSINFLEWALASGAL